MLAGALRCKDPCGLNCSLHTPAGPKSSLTSSEIPGHLQCMKTHKHARMDARKHTHTQRHKHALIHTHAHPGKGVLGEMPAPHQGSWIPRKAFAYLTFCDLGGSGLAAFLGIHNPSVSQPHTPLPIPSWATSFKALRISPEWTPLPFRSLPSLSQISLPCMQT